MSGGFITFNIVMTVLGVLVSAAVPLIFLVVFFRMLRGRHAPTVAPAHPPRRHGHWKWLILVPVIGISLFIGLMVAAVGGALYPPLTRIAAPLACDGDFSIQTSQYSYKPGQHGSTYQTICTDRDTGEPKDVTNRAFLWNTLIFSGVVFVPLFVLALFLLNLLGRLFTSLSQTDALHPHPGSGETLMDRYRKLKETAINQRPAPVDHSSVGEHRSTEDRLRELQRLLDRGLIDTNDYEARKAQILAEL